ncbi:MAG: hypothetical protein KC454_08845 [Flavobacteriales bacterium]|jgi:hypothetical protein|nr:hypothetical protein [Flavobacteriales bacterium]
MNKYTRILLILVVLLIVDYSFSQGCSQCKLLAEQGSEVDEDSFGTNINSGILYLMALPYIALVIVLIAFRKKVMMLFKR